MARRNRNGDRGFFRGQHYMYLGKEVIISGALSQSWIYISDLNGNRYPDFIHSCMLGNIVKVEEKEQEETNGTLKQEDRGTPATP